MPEYDISTVFKSDRKGLDSVTHLLHDEGIRFDTNIDYTCAVYDGNSQVIATGSCYRNTLRCMAVSRQHQGEGLMNAVVSHLMQIQYERGNTHLFLYTKCSSSRFFGDLGFYEIVRIADELVFMENDRHGFENYLRSLTRSSVPGVSVAAIVMNANPFTLGHRYLVERAAAENDIVHLFAVSEEASLIPYSVRRKLIEKGTADLPNVFIHDSGSYIISCATFPSYFQRDEQSVIRGHALLDLTIFIRIAQALGITARYVGEEPRSIVTGIYNDIMKRKLPENGITCTVIPRKTYNGEIISASTVRKAIQTQDFPLLQNLLPPTTYSFFTSKEAIPVIEKIRGTKQVLHY
jgi:[citrate (pro-3S)-lyase] ligase